MTRVKICGLTRPDDARQAAAAGADFLGMVLAPSPRRVDLEGAARIRAATVGGPPRVGVFVNPDRSYVQEAIDAGGLSMVQLHGEEPPSFCAELEVPVIKALRIGRDAVGKALARYRVDYFLADAYDPETAGGTGRTFAWEPARHWGRRCRLFLAGGLRAENVARAVGIVRPYAVDVSSGVEHEPGRKDPARIEAFIAAVRAADRDAALAGEGKPQPGQEEASG